MHSACKILSFHVPGVQDFSAAANPSGCIFQGLTQESKSKDSIIGTGSLKLGEYALPMENITKTNKIVVSCFTGGKEPEEELTVALKFVELRTAQELMDLVNRTIVPSSPLDGEPHSEKEDLFSLKAGLRKVKIFRDYVGVGRAKKVCREEVGNDGRFSGSSDGYEYVFDNDTVDECDEDEAEDKDGFSFQNSFSYGTLAVSSCVEGALYLDFREDGDDDNCIINPKASLESSSKVTEETCLSDSDYALAQSSMQSLLPWKKRKLNFQSPRARGESLLNKAYGEVGEDDIEFDH